MPREDALDLLGWLRHNRPLGMPDRTFDGLLDALDAASAQDAADPADGPEHECQECGKRASDDGEDALLGWGHDEDGELSFCPGCIEDAARQRPTAPPGDRVTAAVEAVEGRVRRWTARNSITPRQCDELLAEVRAAREDNGGAGDA
jgi:hypothetical protein